MISKALQKSIEQLLYQIDHLAMRWHLNFTEKELIILRKALEDQLNK